MASINYLYRSTRENAPLTLRLLYREDGKDYVLGANSKYLIYSREELIENPKLSAKTYWNKIHPSKRLKDIDSSNKQIDVNGDLNKIENYVLDAFEKINPVEATKEWLQGVIDEYHNPNLNNEIPNTLIEFIDYYLKVKTNKSHRKSIKYRTAQKYTTLQNKLKKRKSEFGKSDILLSDINNKFLEKYYEVFSDYHINTTSKELSQIKTLCKFALTEKKVINDEIFNWQLESERTPFIFFNEDEIKLIEEKDNLPESLANARDWLLISLYTGQRVSDFMRFDKSMVKKKKNKNGIEVSLVEFTQVKTNGKNAIALHPKVLKILENRNGDFPRPISSQKYNEYIKDVCKEANINQKVKGSKMNPDTLRKEYGTYEKWELVTSHIGRRSFASNNFGKIPTALLMKATGHKAESAFLAYINKSERESALEISDYYYSN